MDQAIHQLLTDKGNRVLNDHVALRTYNRGPFSLAQMSEIFLRLGYERKGEYDFVEKKLKAFHYEHPDALVPKIFISELLVEKMSAATQQVIDQCLKQLDSSFKLQASHLFGHRPWTPDFSTYQKMYAESEYAAWVYAFGHRVNHFTVLVNELQALQAAVESNLVIQNLVRAQTAYDHLLGEVNRQITAGIEKSRIVA